jgi:hypothetical protein
MKKMIVSHLISNLIWVIGMTVAVLSAAVFIDKGAK